MAASFGRAKKSRLQKKTTCCSPTRPILAKRYCPERRSAKPPNYPHKLTKSRRAAGPAAKPPRAVQTARRHSGRTSLPPMLVQSRRPPRRGEPRTEGGFLQLRVSTLGAPDRTSSG